MRRHALFVSLLIGAVLWGSACQDGGAIADGDIGFVDGDSDIADGDGPDGDQSDGDWDDIEKPDGDIADGDGPLRGARLSGFTAAAGVVISEDHRLSFKLAPASFQVEAKNSHFKVNAFVISTPLR